MLHKNVESGDKLVETIELHGVKYKVNSKWLAQAELYLERPNPVDDDSLIKRYKALTLEQKFILDEIFKMLNRVKVRNLGEYSKLLLSLRLVEFLTSFNAGEVAPGAY